MMRAPCAWRTMRRSAADIAAALEAAGFVVEIARDGEDAWFRGRYPRIFVLVVLDLGLPKLDGLARAQALAGERAGDAGARADGPRLLDRAGRGHRRRRGTTTCPSRSSWRSSWRAARALVRRSAGHAAPELALGDYRRRPAPHVGHPRRRLPLPVAAGVPAPLLSRPSSRPGRRRARADGASPRRRRRPRPERAGGARRAAAAQDRRGRDRDAPRLRLPASPRNTPA